MTNTPTSSLPKDQESEAVKAWMQSMGYTLEKLKTCTVWQIWVDGSLCTTIRVEHALALYRERQEAIREAERETAKTIHYNIDVMCNLVEKIQPGRYDGKPSIDARTLQKTLCDVREYLEVNNPNPPVEEGGDNA